MRTFFSPSAVAGRRQPARLTFAVLLALGASPCQGFAAPEPATNPWHGLAPAMFEHLVPADKAFPGPSAMTLAQDPDGFMWIGTQGGLGRWDGYRMRNFIHSQDDPASLPGDFIQTLHVDGQGRLWVGTTTDGVALYDKLTERFVRYPAGPNGLSSPAVNAIVSDAQGRIWIGTAAGLDYIDTAHGNQVRHVRRPPEAGAGANQIRALYVDVHGNLWVGSNAGLARRDPASGRFDDVALGEGVKDAVLALAGDAHGEVVFGTLKNGVGLARLTAGVVQARILALDPVKDAQNAMVLSLCEIVPGQWWAATYGGGIIEFDTSGRSRRIVHRPAIPTSLSIDRVAAVRRERSGLVWVAHERGVDIHNPLNRTVDTVHDGAGLPEISATTFMTDTAGRLWVGLAEQGVDVIGPDGTRTAALRPDPAQPETALPSRLVLAIAEAEPQEAWIGTLLGLYHTSARGTKVRRVPLPHTDAHPRIGSILREDQQLWLGTANGLLRFDPQANTVRVYGAGPASSGGLTDGRITTMLRGPDNALWVATRNGLNRIDTSSGAVEHMLPMAGVPTALKQGFINSMAFDRKGRLWLGTLSAGVAILHGRTPDGARRFLHLGEEAGLPGGRINSISADAAGRMWASTSDGIIVIDPATLRAQLLGRPEGVVFQSYYAGAVGQTASADIVFGTSGGFAVVHPEPPERWRYQAPLVVSTVRLDRNTVAAAPLLVPGGPGLRIPAGTRSVEIEVAALDYSASQRNRYAFRLDGYDRDWVETDANRRVATYANVAPGRYLLHMRGSNRDGVWSPHELTMELHFLPAWYQTWWARSGAGLLALAFGWGLYRWRVRQLRHTQAMLQQQVYLRTLHLEKVHAIVKSINEQLDFDALLQTILTESGSIGQVRLATAWVGQGADGPLSPRAVWQRAPHALLQPELSRAEAHAQLVAAADAVAPDMFLSREGRVLTVRISIAQQVQGYLVFEQGAPFARSEVELFKALKEPFVSAFQKANAISAMQRARADAEASTRAKSDFLANISHEIRTPMNAILGFAGLGTHLELPTKPREYFSKIARAGHNLLAIIDDVLDFSKIEAGKLELEAMPFALTEVLEQITDLFAWRAAEKGLELLVWSAPGVPSHVVGDPLRLNQILVNLVGNALKFTAHGHIALRVELAAPLADADTVQLRFAVEDTGVGISADQQARLFQAFTQADTSTTRLYGGTGLGLAISQQLVHAMGGEIVIDSAPATGSCFAFTLTLRALAPAMPATPRWSLPPELAATRVLVVDDNPVARTMLLQQLSELGLNAHALDSASGAEVWCQTHAVDLLLADWDLPDGDGIDTARRVRATAAGPALPVLLLASELAREQLGRAAERAGIQGCVAKPSTPAQLLAALLAALGHATPELVPVSATASVSEAAARIAGARVLVVDDNVINQQVAREVLLRAGVQVELASNGIDALALLALGQFDAVLMDIQMPEMDGYEATARIRAQPQHAQLPVIAMTAHAVAGFRENSLAMGMNDYVTKPIEPERLFAVLASWIRLDPARVAPALPVRQSSVPALAVPGIDVAAALERLGGNSELLARLLRKFADEYAPSPAHLLAALEQGALEPATLLVHKVRGAAGNLSMPELHRTAGELEQVLLSARPAPFEEALAAFGAALETVIDGIQALDASAADQIAPVSP